MIVGLLYIIFKNKDKLKTQTKFNPTQLAAIFNERIDTLLKFLGSKTRMDIWHDHKLLGTVTKYTRFKSVENQYDIDVAKLQRDRQALLNKKNKKKIEIPEPEEEDYLILYVRKKGFINKVFTTLGGRVDRLVIKESYLTRANANFYIDRGVQLQPFGGVWIASEGSRKVMNDFAWQFIAETTIEKQANLAKAVSYFNIDHASNIDIKEQEADIERRRYQETTEGKFFS